MQQLLLEEVLLVLNEGIFILSQLKDINISCKSM